MANKIQVKRSAVSGQVPTTTDLDLGEIGVNTYDGKLYIKKDSGTASIVNVGPYDDSSVVKLTGNQTIAGLKSFSNFMGVGTTAVSDSVIKAEGTFTGANSVIFGFYFIPVSTPSASGVSELYGLSAYPTLTGSVNSSVLAGAILRPTVSHTAGTVSNVYGLTINPNFTSVSAGTTTSLRGCYIRNANKHGSSTETITTQTQLYIENPTRGTTNYAIYSEGGTSYHEGPLGIGITSPNTKTEIYFSETNANNGLTITNAANWGYGSRIQFRTRLTNNGSVGTGASIDLGFEASNAFQLRFFTANGGTTAERARLTAAGDFLIGTTSNSGKLTVRGSGTSSSTNGLTVENSSGTDNFVIRDDGAYAFRGGTVGLAQTGYTTFQNYVTLRTLDVNNVMLEDIADVLGTLIEDLKAKGIIAA